MSASRPGTVDPSVMADRPLQRLKSPYSPVGSPININKQVQYADQQFEQISKRGGAPISTRIPTPYHPQEEVNSGRQTPTVNTSSNEAKYGMLYDGTIVPIKPPTISVNDSVANLIAPECDPSSVLAGRAIPRPKKRDPHVNSTHYLIHCAESQVKNGPQYSPKLYPFNSPQNLVGSPQTNFSFSLERSPSKSFNRPGSAMGSRSRSMGTLSPFNQRPGSAPRIRSPQNFGASSSFSPQRSSQMRAY